jgi:hypothetical protein
MNGIDVYVANANSFSQSEDFFHEFQQHYATSSDDPLAKHKAR